ncbi:helix-turn-helix domain-containing protein [Caminicella sporogenes]|uniref:helix-turn-helix domain-containing protein n=1 Tax=Caminicella sporogenes TaxID=166485 RepID=UPI0025401A4B|nr:helix-turn-helix transcriptional regulator [Caminicella sporogenes]WIF95094.1 helix-turn-helix transcriptional regulator [Caminicella sporogenes]
MGFGAYIKNLRKEKGLSQRRLAEMAKVSNTEISRIESGERQKPSPLILKAIAPHLGVSYSELMKKAGYLEEVIEHKCYFESVFRDENGKVIDIEQRAKEMYQKDSDWANLAYRVSTSELTEDEMELIKAQTQALLEQFLKKKK